MKRLTGLLIAGGLTTFLIIVVAGLGIWSFARPVESAPAVPAQSDVAPIEAPVAPPDYSAQLADMEQTMQARGATYEEQLAALQTLIQERETTYQTELSKANSQLAAYQATIAQYQQDMQALNNQIIQLEQALAERQASYQVQIQQTQAQLNARQTELQTQLQAAQATLAEANAQLGR